MHILSAYWITQVAATLIFKGGATYPRYWVASFITANVLNIVGTWLLMILYKNMNANIAMGLALGAAFLLGQCALALVFKSQLTWVQILGIPVTCLGLLLLSLGSARMPAQL